MTPREAVQKVFRSARDMKNEVATIRGLSAPNVRQLVMMIDRLQQNYLKAAEGLTALQTGGLKANEIATLLRTEMFSPPVDLNGTMTAVRTAGQAVVVDYVTNVWPTFQGNAYTFDPATGLHSQVTVALPKSFTDALDALDVALAQIA